MVLDPISALSVAGTVVQFVDFGTRLLHTTTELYNSISGATRDEYRLSFLTTELLKLTTKLSRPTPLENGRSHGTSAEDELEPLCNECNLVAQELLTRLEGLKVKNGSFRSVHSLRKAIKAAWTKEEMATITKRLSSFQDIIQMHVLASLRTNIETTSVKTSQRFDRLDESTQAIVNALTQIGDSSADSQSSEALERIKALDTQIFALTQMMSRSEVVLVNRAIGATVVDTFSSLTQHGCPDHASEPEIRAAQSNEAHVRWLADEAVLDIFRFPAIHERHDEVATAHRKTFEWIFRENHSEQEPWDNFVGWLKSDASIYWVSGKAGSGKSTLMKFIYDNERTTRLLSTWSPYANKAGFFFWNSGSKEQRSQIGLLRSLIVELLQRHRILIPAFFPSLWAQGYTEASSGNNRFSELSKKIWSIPELQELFYKIINQDQVPIMLCVFIDGLDEYDDNKSSIANFVIGISKSPKIKLCVSSRPLLEFGDAFEEYPSLELQDLTKRDIQSYVVDYLSINPRYKQLASQEPQRAPELIQQIELKAQGVFLWVKLVVNSLADGLGNRDTIGDLYRRLEVLPADLEHLYSHMLSGIPAFYTAHASKLFQVAYAVQEVSDVSPRRDAGPLTAIGLSFVMEEDLSLAVTAQIEAMPDDEIMSRCQLVRDRLKVQSAGLLEVQKHHTLKMHRTSGKVQYLHRTVRDFFAKYKIWDQQLGQTKDIAFCPHSSLMRSHLLLLKRIITSFETDTQLESACFVLEHGYFADKSTKGPSNIQVLNDLDKTMSTLSGKGIFQECWTKRAHSGDTFLSTATSYGLCSYVDSKLKKGHSSFIKNERSLLNDALYSSTIHNRMPCCVQMVELLLKRGYDPNTKYNGRSSWESTVFWSYTSGKSSPVHKLNTKTLRVRLDILEAMVMHDADVRIVESLKGVVGVKGRTVVQAVSEEFQDLFPEETERFVNLLRSKGWKDQQSAKLRFGLRGWMQK